MSNMYFISYTSAVNCEYAYPNFSKIRQMPNFQILSIPHRHTLAKHTPPFVIAGMFELHI